MFRWISWVLPRRRYSLSGSNWMDHLTGDSDGESRTTAEAVSDGQLTEAKANWWHGLMVGATAMAVLMLFGITLFGYLGDFLSWLNTVELTALSLLVLVGIGFALYWLVRVVMRNSYERPGPFNGKLDRYGKRKKKEPASAGSEPKSKLLRRWGFGNDHQGGGS